MFYVILNTQITTVMYNTCVSKYAHKCKITFCHVCFSGVQTTCCSCNARRGQLPRTRIGIIRKTPTQDMQYAPRVLHFSAFHLQCKLCIYKLFCEVISVSLHMSVITQDGDSALMMAVREGRMEVASLLLEAGANVHLQDKV